MSKMIPIDPEAPIPEWATYLGLKVVQVQVPNRPVRYGYARVSRVTYTGLVVVHYSEKNRVSYSPSFVKEVQ